MNNNLKFAPSATTPWLVPGSIKAHYKIKMPLLFPPIIVNLRDDRMPTDSCSRDVLSVRELNYFKKNGNNATIFVHGFNVPYGKFPKQINQITMPKSMDCLRPNIPSATFLNTDATVYRNIEGLKTRFPELGTAGLTLPKSLQEENLNGEAAHSWVIHLEDSLNRAAGFDRKDYSKFTRIISVAWSGDVFQADYMKAETKANQAGFGLARLIEQLVAEGIRINVIAHSLGNRVLLVAMNLLGQMDPKKEWIQNAFMWQPAVPDTALSNNPDKDTSVLRNWNFIHAHRAARTIMVLYSNKDNVLGQHADFGSFTQDLADKEWSEAFTGMPGAYRLATVVGVPGSNLVYCPWSVPALYRQNLLNDNLPKVEKALQQEIARDTNGLFSDHLTPQWPEKMLGVLGAWLYARRISREMGEDAMKSIRALTRADYEIKTPRPAMGYGGPEMSEDGFVRDMRDRGKLIPVDQKLWLFTHSGMRIPSDLLFEKVYQEEIVERMKRSTGFGSY